MFKPIDPKIELPKLEAEVLKYWQESKIFEKSLAKASPRGDWNFLDGPPFVTGMPHYGTLLSSIPKDVFGRFWTMKGYHVRRVWGWDGHGLPIENKVEGKLKIKRKRDIEEVVGVEKFIKECLAYVQDVSGEWEWYVDKIARWVDFKNAYKTWDRPYMETVLWVFKQIYEKGYIYKGLRVSLFCPHCSTPISNFEVAMDADNYRDVTEPTAVFKYQLSDRPNTYLLAWSTTPWNKLATTALAVNPNLTYVEVTQGKENYILAKETLKMLKDEPDQIVKEFPGQELIGLKFAPHYDFYPIEEGKKSFVVIGGDFVTAEEGTGIVTIAAYGEEDLAAMLKENIQIVLHVDEEGKLKPAVPRWAGLYYLDVDPLVIEDLAGRNLIYRIDDYTHSVPHCWRCHTRLFYGPQNAWYINIQMLKEKMKVTNEKVNWFPSHFKYGRYLNSLESAPDWCISRSRYWGSPVPVWECVCGERFVPGSIAELEAASGQKIVDLHKPGIDELKVKCRKCGQVSSRVPEVLDSWVEAGSASLAERHFPFAFLNNERILRQTQDDSILRGPLNRFFPPDFIVEYTGQIRAWFYVLHVIATALYSSPAFKNVLVTGVILGTDGRKMSKNYGNYPDPKEMLLKYGGDALRLYLLGSPVMKGEDILISESAYAEQLKFLRLLLNVYNFFAAYASLDRFSPSTVPEGLVPEPREGSNPITPGLDPELVEGSNPIESFAKLSLLDRWILLRLNQTVKESTDHLNVYDTIETVRSLQGFVNDLSLWYVRRSRSRVGPTAPDGTDKTACHQTLHFVLKTLCQLLAPITPFVAEKIYRCLNQIPDPDPGSDDLRSGIYADPRSSPSVHLSSWPSLTEIPAASGFEEGFVPEPREGSNPIDLIGEMTFVRKICELGHADRKYMRINVRQPLGEIRITIKADRNKISPELESLIKEELNVKKVVWNVDDKTVNGFVNEAITQTNLPIGYHYGDFVVKLSEGLTPELKAEGQARELIRKIQDLRKAQGCALDAKIKVYAPSWPKDFADYIQGETLAAEIVPAESLRIESI